MCGTWASRVPVAPGSSAPLRLPIIRPSSAEKPMVVAALRPPIAPHRLAPLPRCAIKTRPPARALKAGSTCIRYW